MSKRPDGDAARHPRRFREGLLDVARIPPKAPGGSRWDDAIHHPRRG